MYLQPVDLADAISILHTFAGNARLVAGGTDLIVELQRAVRPTNTLIDLSALHELKYMRLADGMFHLGALTTHNDVLASADCIAQALPLVQACAEVGAPQIRTRATIAGNLVTASPANDTIPPLMALGAELVLVSRTGTRIVPLRNFYIGVRRTALAPNELLSEIRFPALQPNQRGLFLKLGLRRAQAISVINLAIILTFDNEKIRDVRITLGCLAPTVIHASSAEDFLLGKVLDETACVEAGRLACRDVAPIDDLRGSARYRLATLQSLLAHGLRQLSQGREAEGWMPQPVLLETASPASTPNRFNGVIQTTINGAEYQIAGANDKTLLRLLREQLGLIGTKEGCAEGECGACTVWLNGQAVMSCLVPAPQAHNAAITTIEGLGSAEAPHPLQQAFIEQGAVQCGFCIPGMLMAGAKLLDEQPHPDLEHIQVALSGNICRCTGYRKILNAVGAAACLHSSDNL